MYYCVYFYSVHVYADICNLDKQRHSGDAKIGLLLLFVYYFTYTHVHDSRCIHMENIRCSLPLLIKARESFHIRNNTNNECRWINKFFEYVHSHRNKNAPIERSPPSKMVKDLIIQSLFEICIKQTGSPLFHFN